MESKDELYEAVVNYFTKHPIDVDAIKVNYKENNRFKIIDSATNEPYELGIKMEKFYMNKKEVG